MSSKVNIKQEVKLSDSLILNKRDKKLGRDLVESHKKKKRKQRSPAKVVLRSYHKTWKLINGA